MNNQETEGLLGSRTIVIRKKYPSGLYSVNVTQCEDEKSFFTAVIQCIEQQLKKRYPQTFCPPHKENGKIMMQFQENIAVSSEFPVTVDLSIDPDSENMTLAYHFPVPNLASRQAEIVQTLFRLNQTLKLPKFIIHKEKPDCMLAIYSESVMDCFSEETFLETLKRFRFSLFWVLSIFQDLAREETSGFHD